MDKMNELALVLQADILQLTIKSCPIAPISHTSNPPSKRWCPVCSSLPMPYLIPSHRPAQPDTWRCQQGIKEQYLMCHGNHRFEKCFLFLPPVAADNTDVENIRFTVRLMAMLPFNQFKWGTLKFNCPTLPIRMFHEDISNTIWFRKTFLQ